jgi:predicted Fe-Mo cluster-binding NifX family protein
LRIAIATRDYATIRGHAGKTRQWLIYDLSGWQPGAALPSPKRIELTKEQLFHHFQDDVPHPLDGLDLVVTGSAGEGFRDRLAKRGAEVLLTGESNPRTALEKILAGEALASPRFDITTALCKLRDLLSRHA